jgi:hypothetical protein
MHSPEQIDSTIEHLLSTVDPTVAARVREKYMKDQEQFTKAAKEAQVSDDPAYWAKPNCKHCKGTSFCGTIVNHVNKSLIGDKIRCSCASKRYYSWLQDFRKEYLKRETNGTEKT